MLRRVLTVSLLTVALVAAGCGDDDDGAAPQPTPTADVTPTAEPTPVPSPTAEPPTPTPTPEPEPDCDDADAFAVAEEALAEARLEPGGAWSTDTEGMPFDERTGTGEEFAERLGLDCGVKAVQSTATGGERLLIAAWTGPRFAFVVQATDAPSTPYSLDAVVTILFEFPRGEYLRDDLSLWAAEAEGGETIVIGHLDYNLGATAKGWQADFPPPDDVEPELDSERHAIAVLEAAGARNVGIAQFHELGSEEGYIQFISPTGQINVVDVAPAGWFDPMAPRYNSGVTTRVDVDGLEVRVTEIGPDDEWSIAGELGWACGEFVWIMQPPFNGTTAEMLEMAELIVATGEC